MSPLRNLFPLTLALCGVSCCAALAADETSTTRSVTQKVEVTVNSSSTQDGDDTEPKTTVSGKIVLVGPDGKRHEYDLNDELPEGLQLNLNNAEGGIVISESEGEKSDSELRYMIGVACQPATPLLRQHLKLGTTGVVAQRVSPGMPAATAGIEAGDILLGTDEKDFENIEDLMDAVTEAAGKPLTIRRFHAGEKSEVVVTPVKTSDRDARRAFGDLPPRDDLNDVFRSLKLPPEHAAMLKKLGKDHRFMIHSLGPAIEIEDAEDFEGNFAEMIGRARKQAMERAAGAKKRAAGAHGDSIRAQIKQLKAHVERLEKQLESLPEEK